MAMLSVLVACVFAWKSLAMQPILSNEEDSKLKLFTVATDQTDGYLRFKKSLETYGIDAEILGQGDGWKGGNMRTSMGGGQKVTLLANALKRYKDDPDQIVMFTDSYDLIVTATPGEIVRRFRKFNARVVFGAEGYCWPDKSLSTRYPVVKSGKRYLNSGGFIGYAPEVYAMVSRTVLSDKDDDQLYYTKLFLDSAFREKYSITLDTTSKIFQNLNGAVDDIELKMDPLKGPVAKNMAYNTLPVVIHGNGPSKIQLNWFGNYLAGVFSPDTGCRDCNEGRISLESAKDDQLPTIFLAIFIEGPTPFLSEFFQHIADLNYPKSRISLFLHNNVPFHAPVVSDFLNKYESEYSGSRFFGPEDHIDEPKARTTALQLAIDGGKDYVFSVDGEAQLTNKDVLRQLIEQNRPILVPMMSRYGKLFSNFWGALGENGYYARSDDYLLIVQRTRKGLWNVPHVSKVMLLQKERLPALLNAYSYDSRFDADMSFSKFCRDHGHFMIVTNLAYFGHLINPETYDISQTNPELYQIFENRLEWEIRYIHSNYSVQLGGEVSEIDQPCPDVYRFPLFTEQFCNDLVEVMESFGKWSNGQNEDERLQGGYENVPTRDIHMNQVGLERQWLHVLDEFVRPMQEKIFIGYFHKPAEAIMNFVVRYRPDEQPSLRPHHDASTFTINLALNRAGIDFEGGGCHFARYNCTIRDTNKGWVLMHPGRLTHLHEGLPTTAGTRYIMVSFINP